MNKNNHKDALNKKDLDRFKKLLLQRRAVLQGDAEFLEGEALEQSTTGSSGANSSMPVHFADLGSDNFEQEFDIELLENKEEIIQQIDEALERIEAKTFGKCDTCGEMIKRTRMEALPWTKCCIECQNELEKSDA